jgi:hypothetical protein
LISGLALSDIASCIRDLARAAELLPAPLNQRAIAKLVRALLDDCAYLIAYSIANFRMIDSDLKYSFTAEACCAMGKRDEAVHFIKRIRRKTRKHIQSFVDLIDEILNDEWYWLRERIDIEYVMFYKKNAHLKSIKICRKLKMMIWTFRMRKDLKG